MTPNDTHMVDGIKVWRGLICSVSDWMEGSRSRGTKGMKGGKEKERQWEVR